MSEERRFERPLEVALLQMCKGMKRTLKSLETGSFHFALFCKKNPSESYLHQTYKDYLTAAVPSALDLNEGRFEQPPATIIASRRLRAPKNICVH